MSDSAVSKSPRPEPRPEEERLVIPWGDVFFRVESREGMSEEDLVKYWDDKVRKEGISRPYDENTGKELPLYESIEEAQGLPVERPPMEEEPKTEDTRTFKEKAGGYLDKAKNAVKAAGWFDEGGMVEETTMALDPMIENEIPAGGNPDGSGVEDDIQINVSEGEYIIPENVASFIGIGPLEKLVETANERLAEMEVNGRTGQDPTDLVSEIEANFAEGGLIADNDLDSLLGKVKSVVNTNSSLRESLSKRGVSFADGGVTTTGTDTSLREIKPFQQKLWSPPGVSYFDQSRRNETSGDTSGTTTSTDIRIYVNRAGQKMSITFVDGKPVTPIPAGYFPEGSGHVFGDERPEPTDYNSMSDAELQGIVDRDAKAKAAVQGMIDSSGFIGKALGNTIIGKAMTDIIGSTHPAQSVLDERGVITPTRTQPTQPDQKKNGGTKPAPTNDGPPGGGDKGMYSPPSNDGPPGGGDSGMYSPPSGSRNIDTTSAPMSYGSPTDYGVAPSSVSTPSAPSHSANSSGRYGGYTGVGTAEAGRGSTSGGAATRGGPPGGGDKGMFLKRGGLITKPKKK